jgi:hypothetical protein
MWICINPQKTNRFITKGINLYKGAPTAFIGPETSEEVMSAIYSAINDGRVIRMQGNEIKGLSIKNQATIEEVSDDETELVIRSKSKIIEGQRTTIISMPDRDGNIDKKRKNKSSIILTGIQDMPLEEDEE